MYNEKIKENWLEQYESPISTKKYLRNKFNQMETFEDMYSKDASNFTITEIIEYYKYISTASVEVLYVLNQAMIIYTQFCINNMIVDDNQNHYLEINNNILDSCVNKTLFYSKYVTREYVYDIVDRLKNESDKFVLLGLYEGLKGKDFCDITYARYSDIDTENGTIKLSSGRTIKISKKLQNIACLAKDEYEYYTRNDKVFKLQDDEYPDEIVKVKSYTNSNTNSWNKGRRIYVKIQNLLKEEFPNASLQSIWESGRIAMVKNKLKEYGLSVDDYMNLIARDKGVYNLNDVVNQYGRINSIDAYMLKYKEYLEWDLKMVHL